MQTTSTKIDLSQGGFDTLTPEWPSQTMDIADATYISSQTDYRAASDDAAILASAWPLAGILHISLRRGASCLRRPDDAMSGGDRVPPDGPKKNIVEAETADMNSGFGH